MTLRALRDLFLRHRDRATGLWKLSEEGGRTVYLEAGDIVFATSGRPADRLTALLVERGRLTQVQLDYALANLKPGLSIGRNLIDMGYITQRDLLEVARLQVERVVQGSLGARDEVPVFEPQELDAATVRLPLDTPQLLLNGLLELQDREGLLELIGPLNQVVVLEGRKHLALSLPSDLAKLPPLFDGTRTLLELGRELPIEPFRLAVFALFLREVGWARLHELPPLDRGALDLALTPEALSMSEPLPDPSDPELPNLFAAIRDAERPTTNLEHLSQSLDDVLESAPEPVLPPPAVAAPAPEPFLALPLEALPEPVLAEGEVSMPTPAFELPEFPEPESAHLAEPSLTLQPDSFSVAESVYEGASTLAEPEPVSRRWAWLLGAAVVLAGLGAGGYALMRRKAAVPPSLASAPTPASTDVKPSTAAPAPARTEVPPPTVEPIAAEAPAKSESQVAPKPLAKSSGGGSLEAIRAGRLEEAVKAGEHLVQAHKSQWCLRLMLATQVETVKRSPALFEEKSPALFLLPFRFRDGRTSYQVLLGPFPDRATAEARLRTLPAPFRTPRNRPLVFRLGEVPRKQ